MVKMSKDDKHALTEFLIAVGVTSSAFLIMIGLFLAAYIAGADSKPPDQLFEVVDKYKNCEVVRYSPGLAAEYKYFLHCPNND